MRCPMGQAEKNNHQPATNTVRSTKKPSMAELFNSEINKQPKIAPEDKDRCLRAVHLITEHIRSHYNQPRSADSIKKLHKLCMDLIHLETADLKEMRDCVCKAELMVIEEAKAEMNGLNGMELALCFKNSGFIEVRESAEDLMTMCTGSQVRGDSV